MELVVEAEDVAGDAQAQLVGGLPRRDRRSTGDDDRQHLGGDGDGEEEQREADDLSRGGAVRGEVDDAADHEWSRQHERRAGRDERAEDDPTPRVGSQQRHEGARARRRRDPHVDQFPRRCRSGSNGFTLPHMEPRVVERDDEVEASELVEEELLVEEISIDGMCGVY